MKRGPERFARQQQQPSTFYSAIFLSSSLVVSSELKWAQRGNVAAFETQIIIYTVAMIA